MFRQLLNRLHRNSPSSNPSPLPAPAPEDLPGAPRLDVGGMIRQASTRISVDQLVRQGKRYIQLLSGERIEELINRSVQTIVEKHRAEAREILSVPVAQIAAESKAEFTELLEEFRQTSEAKSEIERSKQSLDQELEKLRKDLETERASRASRSSRPPEEELPAAFEEFTGELGRQIDRAFEQRRLLLDRSESPEAVAEFHQIEELLRRILSRLMDLERGQRTIPGDERETAKLLKRIDKLSEYIASLENALKTLSNSKVYSNQQVQNLLRQLGLAQEDKHFEKKKEMLKIVLDTNRDIRKRAKALEERGITLAHPLGSAAAPSDSAAPPVATATMEWSLGRTA